MKAPIFNQVQQDEVKRNIFDLTHDRKFSGKMANLMPIMVLDTVPGDTITLSSAAMVRLAPTIAPVMHRMNVYIHHFFVPNRILWDNWEDFITGGRQGLDASVPPNFNTRLDNKLVGSLHDYLGLPVDTDVKTTSTREYSALPFSAYRCIYEEYYRDQNFEAETDWALSDGTNITTNFFTLLTRCWEHDYLTSALPWTQRGPEAMLPLGTAAPVVLESGNTNKVYIVDQTGVQNPIAGALAAAVLPTNGELQAAGVAGQIDPNGTLLTDLSAATASSITELRRAIKLQEWLEKNARGGSRYVEVMQVHFGVKSSDQRLQRPEYIGGSKTPIKISEVLQTGQGSAGSGTSPVGTMNGHGISVGGSEKFTYYCEEHGYIMSIMSVLPETTYQQGIPRHFLRTDKFDYYWPEFAHIGEQQIFNDEVVVEGGQDAGLDTWGYTPRYAEYKFINNSVHGDYRTSLDFWHLGRKFTSLPALNEDFVHMATSDSDRIFAVQDGTDYLWCHVINEVEARRPMPVFGSPKM